MGGIKHLVASLVDKAGYAIVPHWRRSRLALSDHLATLFERFRIDCVFDVGANKGQYGQFLRSEVGYSGTILSFEPVRENFAALEKTVGLDACWTAYGYGLGDENARRRINVMKSDSFSSFLDPSHVQVADFAAMNAIDHTEEVTVQRLDDVMAGLQKTHNFSRVYLKLDTQGYDLEVIGGAKNSLQYVSALQSEISILPIYVGMPDYITSLKTFQSLGFAISNMFAVTVLERSLKAVEFDCVMVREAAALEMNRSAGSEGTASSSYCHPQGADG